MEIVVPAAVLIIATDSILLYPFLSLTTDLVQLHASHRTWHYFSGGRQHHDGDGFVRAAGGGDRDPGERPGTGL